MTNGAHELHESNKTSIRDHRVFLYFDEDHSETYINSDLTSESDSSDIESEMPLPTALFSDKSVEPELLNSISLITDAYNFVSDSTLFDL